MKNLPIAAMLSLLGGLLGRPAAAQNVGVGLTSPVFTLQVRHNNGTPAIPTNENGLAVSHAAGPTWVLYASATDNSLNFYRNGVREAVLTADGLVDNVSDSTAKKEIRLLGPDQLTKIMQLRPKSYLYKTQSGGSRHYGLMAQELNAVYPEMVHHGLDDDGKEFWMVSYQKLLPVLVKGMQEQQEQLQRQQAQLEELQRQVEALTQLQRRTSQRGRRSLATW